MDFSYKQYRGKKEEIEWLLVSMKVWFMGCVMLLISRFQPSSLALFYLSVHHLLRIFFEDTLRHLPNLDDVVLCNRGNNPRVRHAPTKIRYFRCVSTMYEQ
mmetsp:Transcript_6647/g.10056  ORF Transcript_6647/g.10056 Transcript_6647/m.10056 type:complete len:101 (+) Transcript_6647:35-337(+)